MEEKERYDTDDTSCLSPLEEADEAVAKRERRRQKIIKEMLDTERTYQNHLELIIQVNYNILLSYIFGAGGGGGGRDTA